MTFELSDTSAQKMRPLEKITINLPQSCHTYVPQIVPTSRAVAAAAGAKTASGCAIRAEQSAGH